MKNAIYELSFRCYYPDGEPTNHRQSMKLSDIHKWIDAYKFTHPNCTSITVKIWLTNIEN